jgi:thioesterase domain-containing protein
MCLTGPTGWSLGGVISLEMAQILSEDDELDVVGVVLIDSLYPPMVLEENAKVARQENSDSYIDVRDISYNNMTKEVQAKILTSLNLAVGASLRYELPSELNVPPAVLIRASLPIPSREGEVVPHALGWDRDEREIVKLVYQVPGHHFSMFEEKNVLTPWQSHTKDDRGS